MQIDWTHFTPFSALSGGALIGLAAAILLLAQGRILGAAGIFAGAVEPRDGDFRWRLLLLAGLVAAGGAAALLFSLRGPALNLSPSLLLSGGFLVGLGARLANGCTSGHGVCGLARLSPRSIAATLTFMGAAMLVVFLMRHVAG